MILKLMKNMFQKIIINFIKIINYIINLDKKKRKSL